MSARTGRAGPGTAREIFAGLTFVLRQPVLRKIAACTATWNLFGAMASALGIIFLVRLLHVRPADAGLLLAAGSLGGVMSGLVARAIGSARMIWFAPLVFGVIAALLPAAEPGWRLALYPVGLAGMTFSGVLYNIAQLSYRQTICPPELLEPMNSAVRWIVWGTLPLGGLLGGALGSELGVRPTLWIAVTGCYALGSGCCSRRCAACAMLRGQKRGRPLHHRPRAAQRVKRPGRKFAGHRRPTPERQADEPGTGRTQSAVRVIGNGRFGGLKPESQTPPECFSLFRTFHSVPQAAGAPLRV